MGEVEYSALAGFTSKLGGKSTSVALLKEAIKAANADYKAKHDSPRAHLSNPSNVGALNKKATDVGAASSSFEAPCSYSAEEFGYPPPVHIISGERAFGSPG